MTIDGLSFSKLTVAPRVRLQPGDSPPSGNDPNNQNQIQTMGHEFLKRADFYQPGFDSYQKSLQANGLEGVLPQMVEQFTDTDALELVA
jgi:hypothetical protein